MSKQIFLALAAGFAAAAAAFEGGDEIADTPNGDTAAPAAGKRRGRPPGGGAAGTTTGDAGATAGVKTFEELRAAIAPLIEAGQGEDVKKVIAKYGAALKDIPADKQPAFLKDIEAMSY